MDQQDSTSGSSSTNQSNTNNGVSLKDFILADKISFAMWIARLIIIISSLLFIVPISGINPFSLYQKALLGNAVVSALKLHQRLDNIPFQLNRAYFQTLFIEDSCHYLLYSIIFLNSYPITVILTPIVLFALLHVAAYTRGLTYVTLNPLSATIRKGCCFIISKDKDIMKFAAMNEILLMPCVVVIIFTGQGAIFTPFIYYRFLCLRYQSRRNPYNRQVFSELRMASEYFIAQQKCPQFVRNMVTKMISYTIRLAPTQ